MIGTYRPLLKRSERGQCLGRDISLSLKLRLRGRHTPFPPMSALRREREREIDIRNYLCAQLNIIAYTITRILRMLYIINYHTWPYPVNSTPLLHVSRSVSK